MVKRKVATTLGMKLESGAVCESGQFVLGEAHSFRQVDAETVEKCGLSGIGWVRQRRRMRPCIAVGRTTPCD
jgi:hypothetical protein